MPAKPRTPLVVCADDYALTPGVSRAIRELIAAGRISATSVMTVCPWWAEEAAALAAVAGAADIGLHLTLTDQSPLGAMPTLAPVGRLPPIDRLVRASILGRLPVAEIEAEIERQLVAFVEVWKRPPAHVDGHHHVHQLPGVRSALFRVLEGQRFGRPYLRSCHEAPARIIAAGRAVEGVDHFDARSEFRPLGAAAGLFPERRVQWRLRSGSNGTEGRRPVRALCPPSRFTAARDVPSRILGCSSRWSGPDD